MLHPRRICFGATVTTVVNRNVAWPESSLIHAPSKWMAQHFAHTSVCSRRRYCILYVEGGVWVDTDIVPLVPMREWNLQMPIATLGFVATREKAILPGAV
jgi:hypothetical protein